VADIMQSMIESTARVTAAVIASPGQLSQA
jgi:hypothetical protein